MQTNGACETGRPETSVPTQQAAAQFPRRDRDWPITKVAVLAIALPFFQSAFQLLPFERQHGIHCIPPQLKACRQQVRLSLGGLPHVLEGFIAEAVVFFDQSE